jgi:imidazolonepropionase-like amidohydrolase
MKRLTIYLSTLLILLQVKNSIAQQSPILFQGATIHVGNGAIIENGYLGIAQGKIGLCSTQLDSLFTKAVRIDVTGKHIYPGLISLNNMMGLNEVEAVRATLDFKEVGELNPNVRSLIAFNTDSKIVPTALANGILYTQPVPQGGLISGTSSLMRTTGWNWEDAAYKIDDGIHLNWPEENSYSGWWAEPGSAQQQKVEKEIKTLNEFFDQAQQYANTATPSVFNARLNAMKGVFKQSQNVYIHVSEAKSIATAIVFFNQYPAINIVLVDATDAWQVKELIKEKNIPIVFTNVHQLPKHYHSAIDQPYKTVSQLVKEGITVAIGHNGYWEVRNLMYNAGTAVAYGLTKEEALQCITLNAAKIVGVAQSIGSLEKTKDASFVISSGDILDMPTSIVERAFMDGTELNLDNQQKQLYKKYSDKYNLK